MVLAHLPITIYAIHAYDTPQCPYKECQIGYRMQSFRDNNLKPGTQVINYFQPIIL